LYSGFKEGEMMTTWKLNTHGQPLTAVRQFLQNIWDKAGLMGMLIPIYSPDRMSVDITLINDPARLADADPFAPLMRENSGKLVAQFAKQQPNARLAAVLHPCEMRALDENIQRDNLDLENWLLIGTECLSCFSSEDFEWRVKAMGDVEGLTNLVLRNARQGGIAPDRFRSACQMCSHPEPTHIDLCLGILGLPVTESLLVFAKKDGVTERLHLPLITNGPAPLTLISQHDHMLKTIEERRLRARERILSDLLPEMPSNLEELVIFLKNCQPCRSCLEACPVASDSLIPALESGFVSMDIARQWLVACSECGMCEQACPNDVPMAAIVNRISHSLKSEPLAV